MPERISFFCQVSFRVVLIAPGIASSILNLGDSVECVVGIGNCMDRHNEADHLTEFLEMVDRKLEYQYWFFGHFHDNRSVDQKHILLWEQIVQIL